MDKNSTPPPDYVQGFYLRRSGIRGRLVRLGPALDAIIRRHHYPETVASLLGETLALAAALAASIKYDGVFTLQTKGDGPVDILVADMASDGAMRGYAQFNAERLQHAGVKSALLLGKGHLAFTVDSGTQAERTQGIVELIGRTMAEVVKTYFRQSEQIDSEVYVQAAPDTEGHWQAGAVILQRMPEGGGYAANNNTPGGAPANEERAEDWSRAGILLSTLSTKELFDPALPGEILLHRLFHEEDLETGTRLELRDQCRCSRSRVAMVLSTIPPTEMKDLMIGGKVQVKCEFCSTAYEFDAEQLKQLEPGPGVRS
ncbi:MAG: Hsp33 family molecular chaperone HslO [Proteobacteria bacterium]|nr:Hsp33 family molecular chaperone HslO [Pseudomonadota bacterium]